MEEFFLSPKEIINECNESIIIMLFIRDLSPKDAIKQEYAPLNKMIDTKKYIIEEYGKTEFIIANSTLVV